MKAFHATTMHSHPFWQMDYYENASKVEVKLDDKTLVINKKSPAAFIIPPFKAHKIKVFSDCICYGLKFEIVEPGIFNYIASEVPLESHRKCLEDVLKNVPAKGPLHVRILELYLEALMLSLAMESGNPGEGVRSVDSRVLKAFEFIRDNLAEDIGADSIAVHCGLSLSHFNRIFRRETGLSPMSYLRNERIKKAAELLEYTDFTVGQVASFLNFPDIYTFSRCFKKINGSPPMVYRKTRRTVSG